ncbi:MAG: hypothetical protein COC01_04155 [Bacteroidetes bacterium]|nr:MAG: hypothetical protein COC01_04155 [Bacteroidota bacterium]
MKGIIFNLLEEFITENHGEETYDEIIGNCTLQTKEPFVGPGTYPDEDLLEIVGKTTEKLGISADVALKAFGKFAFHKLAAIFPNFLESYSNPKDFLKSVESVIHVEVKKMYKDAYTPTFIYTDLAPDKLIIQYHSKRKLYALMEGLIDGVGEHFNTTIGQSVKIHEVDGREVGDFDLTFS